MELGCFAEDIENNMSATEYLEWMEFFKARAQRAEGKSGNLLALQPQDMVAALTK